MREGKAEKRTGTSRANLDKEMESNEHRNNSRGSCLLLLSSSLFCCCGSFSLSLRRLRVAVSLCCLVCCVFRYRCRVVSSRLAPQTAARRLVLFESARRSFPSLSFSLISSICTHASIDQCTPRAPAAQKTGSHPALLGPTRHRRPHTPRPLLNYNYPSGSNDNSKTRTKNPRKKRTHPYKNTTEKEERRKRRRSGTKMTPRPALSPPSPPLSTRLSMYACPYNQRGCATAQASAALPIISPSRICMRINCVYMCVCVRRRDGSPHRNAPSRGRTDICIHLLHHLLPASTSIYVCINAEVYRASYTHILQHYRRPNAAMLLLWLTVRRRYKSHSCRLRCSASARIDPPPRRSRSWKRRRDPGRDMSISSP